MSPRGLIPLPVALGALVAFSPLVGASEPAARFPAEQPAPLSARVALLEGRVYSLEQQVQSLARGQLQRRADGSYQFDANGARVVVGPSGTVTTSRSPQAKADCDPPYAIDARGIRSIKPECLEVSECDPPYTVDSTGIRRPKPQCP
ncbi:MAG: hypothetical protein R3B13_34855 [Polyangiaceae bacterium]